MHVFILEISAMQKPDKLKIIALYMEKWLMFLSVVTLTLKLLLRAYTKSESTTLVRRYLP